MNDRGRFLLGLKADGQYGILSPMRKNENIPAPRAVELVIFDMDGVLVNSEPLHERAHREQLEELGLAAYQDSFNTIGVSTEEFLQSAIERARRQGADVAAIPSLQTLTERHFIRAQTLILRNCPPAPAELVQTLRRLRAAGVRCAVASSSRRSLVDAVLEAKGLRSFFCCILCGDEVANMKPAPDIYLRVLALTGTEASHALAVEDSPSGQQAAAAAGVFCLGFAPYGQLSPQTAAQCSLSSFSQLCDYI